VGGGKDELKVRKKKGGDWEAKLGGGKKPKEMKGAGRRGERAAGS